MSISLKKGQKVSLTKESAGLSNVLVGLGWDAAESEKKGFFASLLGSGSADIDCDATAILLKGGKFCDKSDVVYFGNLQHKSGTVRHMETILQVTVMEMMSRFLLSYQKFRQNMTG